MDAFFLFSVAGLGSLLVALLAISVQSAPTMTMEDRRLASAPKWMNPCGFAAEEFEGDLDVVQLNDETLLGNIVMQAKTALNYAQGFRDDYVSILFRKHNSIYITSSGAAHHIIIWRELIMIDGIYRRKRVMVPHGSSGRTCSLLPMPIVYARARADFQSEFLQMLIS